MRLAQDAAVRGGDGKIASHSGAFFADATILYIW